MKKFIPVLMAFLFAIAFSYSFALSAAQVNAQDTTPECTSLEGDNINDNNVTSYSAYPVYSYMIPMDNRYMRVQAYYDRGNFTAVYYDKSFNTISRVDVEAELPLFGGFYATETHYYIVSGQQNLDESNDVEVFRVTKYDKSWNRLGSCSLYGADTQIPFRAGSCRMTHYGNKLFVRTCHTMYKSDDGLNHQSNMTIVVNTDNMSATKNGGGYASHSFNQFITTDGSEVVTVDLGDAYPRSVILNTFDADNFRTRASATVMKIEGAIGQNITGVSLGGLEVSDSSYLVTGNSVKRDDNFLSYKTRNIFVAEVDKSTKEVAVHWHTNIPEGSGTTGTPHIVKAGTNRYMVLWYQDAKVKYMLVDGHGEAVSEIYSMGGNLSDCRPFLDDGNIVWYTWQDTQETFYKIPVSDPANPEVIKKVKGHTFELNSVADGLANVTCTRCGEQIVAKVPTSFSFMWSKPSNASYVSWSSQIPSGLEPGSVVNYKVGSVGYSAEADIALDDMILVSSDPENCIIDMYKKTVRFLKGGNYTVTAYPKFNPSKKVTYKVYILKELEEVALTASHEGLDKPGTRVTLNATPEGGKGTLEYEFFVIDSEGQETLIQDKGTSKYCYWTPSESGNYKLRVDVTDPGDNNNKVSSNVIDFHIHNYKWQKTENGIATLQCEFCDSEITGRVPTGCTVFWNWDPSDSYYYGGYPSRMDVGTTLGYWIRSIAYSADSSEADNTYSQFSMKIDEPNGYTVAGTYITFNEAGVYHLTLFPTYNPEFKKNYTVTIVKPLESVSLEVTPESQQVYGDPVTLGASVDGGKGALKYTYIVKDSAGNETVLVKDSNAAQYKWTPPTVGTYKLYVQVKDTGDNNNTITSKEVDYTIVKAPHPTVMPKQQYTVPFTVSQVSDDIIADAAGWAFDEADLGSELAEGETAQFTVHYVGADAGNFENLDAVIQVKRAECTHGLASMVVHPATPFTCEKDGNDPYWQCSLCKRYFSDEDAQNEIPEGSWIISAHHMLTELAANNPTCEATGNIYCWQCDVCSKYFKDEDGLFGLTDEEVIVPATGHDWGEWQETEDVSTCVHAGQLVRVCKNDSAHVESKNADLLAHDMIETPEVPATCEEPGNIQYWQCKNCGNYFKDAEGVEQIGEADLVIPPLDHDYDYANGTVITPATCTEQGEIQYTCTHDASHTITDVLPALGHKWNAGKITTAPTATKKGVKTFTCTRCGGTRTQSLPARNNQVATNGTKVGAGASEEVANKAITGMKSDSDPAGSVYGLLKVRSTKQAKTSVTIAWSKVKGAKKYVVYGNACGKSNKMKKIKTLTGNKLTVYKIITNKGKKVKVKKGTYYKFIIVALNGKRDVVSTSKVIHVATKGGKVGNDKSVTTKAKKNKVTVKVGKTFSLRAKAVPASKKLTVKRHRGIAYESSNKAIATVSAKGVIKGKKKGICSVYVYAQNGICKKITVTVK